MPPLPFSFSKRKIGSQACEAPDSHPRVLVLCHVGARMCRSRSCGLDNHKLALTSCLFAFPRAWPADHYIACHCARCDSIKPLLFGERTASPSRSQVSANFCHLATLQPCDPHQIPSSPAFLVADTSSPHLFAILDSKQTSWASPIPST